MPTAITTEYTKCVAENDVDFLQGRMQYSILDVVEHMKQCGMSEEEIKGLILRDVEQIIDTRFKQIKKNEMFKRSFLKDREKQNKERKNHEEENKL